MLKNKIIQSIFQELLWLTVIVVVCVAFFYPIFQLGTYKFLWMNTLYIAVFITYTRWVVNFKETMYLQNKWVKIFIFLLNFQLFIFSVNKLQDIIPLWETQSLLEYVYHIQKEISLESTVMYLGYIKNLILLSGISCCAATIFLSARILGSFFTANRLRRKAMLKDL